MLAPMVRSNATLRIGYVGCDECRRKGAAFLEERWHNDLALSESKKRKHYQLLHD
jgi:hypothetical protein